MAILATDGQFQEGWFAETAVSLDHRLGLAAVTRDTAGKNGTVESVVAKFESGRESPTVNFRIKGKRRLEKEIVGLDDGAAAICPRADKPLYLAGLAEHFVSVRSGFVFALVEVAVSHIGLEMTIEPGIKDAGRCSDPFEQGRCDL